jgi:beta-1,4-mannosyl-glycoprotein beta-1,4-N-acetylglucosaminyltransferase
VIDEQPKNILGLIDGESKEKRGEKLILNGMARDYFQRENLIKGLSDILDDDIVLISDLDEIPNLQNINLFEIKNNTYIFEQAIFYYKLNLIYDDFVWQGTRGTKYKNFISPQWLRNIKGKNYPKWRLDTFFSKKKYSNLVFIKNGGWHFTCLKTPEQLQKKLLNFAHHYEFEESGLKLDDIKKIIREKRIIYDYKADQKEYKWSGKSTLKKADTIVLPPYVASNLDIFKNWLD